MLRPVQEWVNFLKVWRFHELMLPAASFIHIFFSARRLEFIQNGFSGRRRSRVLGRDNKGVTALSCAKAFFRESLVDGRRLLGIW